jgi:hypothetical protein
VPNVSTGLEFVGKAGITTGRGCGAGVAIAARGVDAVLVREAREVSRTGGGGTAFVATCFDGAGARGVALRAAGGATGVDRGDAGGATIPSDVVATG